MNWTDFFATQSVLHRSDRPTAASLQSCCCFCCCRWGCSAILLLLPPASPIRAFVITLVRHQPNTVLLLQLPPTHGHQRHQQKAKPSWYWCGEMNYTLQRSTNITFVYSCRTKTTRLYLRTIYIRELYSLWVVRVTWSFHFTNSS